MRYFMTVLLVALAVACGCKKKEDVTTDPEMRHPSARQDLIGLGTGHGYVRVFPYKWVDHDYLVFVYENGYGGGISVVELTDAPR